MAHAKTNIAASKLRYRNFEGGKGRGGQRTQDVADAAVSAQQQARRGREEGRRELRRRQREEGTFSAGERPSVALRPLQEVPQRLDLRRAVSRSRARSTQPQGWYGTRAVGEKDPTSQ